MVDQSISDNHSLSIIVYAMKLTGHNTMVISSVVSGMDGYNQPNLTILLRDNIADAKLISKSDLAMLGNVNFGVMEFKARNIGASEISLVAEPNSASTNYSRQIARFVEPPEDPAVISGRTYMIGTGQTFEQDGYKISFVGWVPPPSRVTPSTVGSTGDVTIVDEATLRIESISTGKIEYLDIRFLSNGETTSELIR